jgi:hypothetical protein
VNAELEHTDWRKSSRSSGGSNNCIEVAIAAETVGVRDTKDRPAGHLAVTSRAWLAFLETVAD